MDPGGHGMQSVELTDASPGVIPCQQDSPHRKKTLMRKRTCLLDKRDKRPGPETLGNGRAYIAYNPIVPTHLARTLVGNFCNFEKLHQADIDQAQCD